MKTRKLANYELEGVDTRDYPDFCDAFVSWAEWDDGQELTEAELDELNQDGEFLNAAAHESCF